MSKRPIDAILSALGGARLIGGRYTARCPAHDDAEPSLRIWVAPDGACCLKCMSAGCSTEQILAALGMSKRDLFPREGVRASKRKPERRKFNFDGGPVDSELETVYIYDDQEGTYQYETCRWRFVNPTPSGKTKTFTQRRKVGKDIFTSLKAAHYIPKGNIYFPSSDDPNDIPAEPGTVWKDEPNWVLYRLREVIWGIKNGGEVWLCEGEKDVDRLRREGVTATCNAMGAGKWKHEYTHQLAGASRVIIVVDRDEAGFKHALMVRKALVNAEIGDVCLVMARHGKDAHDHLSAGLSLDEFLTCDPEAELARLDAQAAGQPEDPDQPIYVAAGVVKDSRGSKRAQERHGDDSLDEDGEPSQQPPEGWRQPTNDLDNFDLFMEWAGADIRYCSVTGRYLSWDGTRWLVDRKGGAVIRDHWQSLARAIETRAPHAIAAVTNDRLKKLIAKHQQYSLSISAFKAILTSTKYSLALAIEPAELDCYPDLLPCLNLTIDLRTGRAVPNPREMFMTKRVEVTYDPKAECPTWIECLRQWTAGDKEMQRFLWKMVGYWLTGHTQARKFFLFIGPTGTGKTTFVSTLQRLMGEYACVLNKREIMTKKSETVPENIAELKGRRLSVTPEVDSSDRFDEGLMLQLSGEDKIRARHMRQDGFEFDATHKMVLFGNSRPGIFQQGDAMWNRIMPVPFEQQMIGSLRDDSLKKKLAAEFPGILAWAVAGAMAWYAEGLGEPTQIVEKLAEYREDMDELGQFLRAATSADPGGKVTANALFAAYLQWARQVGELRPVTQNRFGRRMGDRPDVKRGRDNRNCVVYFDILIKADYLGISGAPL